MKCRDGSAAVKAIAHVYKTQVYATAMHMGLPEEICNSVAVTDTHRLDQGQHEFYFALPYRQMDLTLWTSNLNCSAAERAEVLDIDEDHANFVYHDIEKKRITTRYLHAAGMLVENVPEISK